ncbi:MAG: hypothetical protein CMJ27_12170 [Phycisphaerae bacterium]|nr:hypothetical protein [Phycisphaerae bacterium]
MISEAFSLFVRSASRRRHFGNRGGHRIKRRAGVDFGNRRRSLSPTPCVIDTRSSSRCTRGSMHPRARLVPVVAEDGDRNGRNVRNVPSRRCVKMNHAQRTPWRYSKSIFV